MADPVEDMRAYVARVKDRPTFRPQQIPIYIPFHTWKEWRDAGIIDEDGNLDFYALMGDTPP